MSRALSTVLLATLATLFGAPSSRADTASATLAATSDYVFRGISQSRGDPAVQAGVTYATDAGWYVSAWGSTVRFAPEIDANAEIDLVAGWAGTVSGKWTADVNVTHFWYPGTAIDSDYTELIASLAWDDVYKATLGWSPDVFASGSHGTYLQASARWPFAQVYRIEAALGHYQLSDGYGDDYLHWQLSGVRTFAPFELRLSFHNTDSAASTLFHGVAGSRIEFAIQLSL